MAESSTGRRFNHRAFVSLTIALAAGGLPVTGIANHVLQLEPMTVARHAWMSAHNSLGVVFVVFVTWHIILNRRALATHLRGLIGRVPAAGRELLWALAVVAVTTGVVVMHAVHLR